MRTIDPIKIIIDVFSNLQLGGELMKIHYPKLTVTGEVEHTVSLFFNKVSKIPGVNKMITAHT